MSALSADDQLAVAAALTAYCAAIDRRGNAAATAAFFTEDGVLDNTALGSPLVTGQAALIETITGMFTTMARLEHYLTNFLITGQADGAVQTQCYVQAHGAPIGGDAFAMRGIYRVELQRLGANWKIARLTFQPFG